MSDLERYDMPRSEWVSLINEWIFNEQHRAILIRRLLDGKSYDDLANEFHLSPERIRKIVYKAQVKLFKHI